MKNKIRPILLILFLIGIIVSSISLYQNQLWEYSTLFLFLSVYGCYIVWRIPKFSALPRSIEYIGWATLSGVLLWVGFPSLGISPLLLFAFLPLLWIERKISTSLEGIQKKEIFKYSFHTFIIWNILSTYWVGNSSLFAGIFAIVANSFLMTLPWVLFHLVKKRMPNLGYASLISFWLTFEFFHFRWDLSWPWLTLGNGFASFHSWIQWYEFTGVLGGTFWILMCNVFAFQLFEKFIVAEKVNRSFLPLLGMVVIPIVFSLYLYYSFQESDEKINVICVQPNEEPHYEQGRLSDEKVLQKSSEYFEPLLDSTVNYLLFPESTFGTVFQNNETGNEAFRIFSMMTTMEHPELNIIAGATGVHSWKDKKEYSPTTRTRIIGTDTTYYHVFNGAYQMGEEKIQSYKKSKLVIGPEFLPFSKALSCLDDFISSMGGSLNGFETDEKRKVFSSSKGKAAPVICYEQNFGHFMRGYIHGGADFIAIITNDGWWGNTSGYVQHREFARLRAIEFRRSIARAANTGSSCFINPRGDLFQVTKYGETTAIKKTISLNKKITYYSRVGDMIGRLSLFLSILFILNILVKVSLGNK